MGWIQRVGNLWRRGISAEHEEELEYHLSRSAATKAEAGMTAEEARLAARRRFGNVTAAKEEMREADLFTFVESVGRDVRFAARMLAKHPGFTAIAVLGLAVGIGVNTAVFTAYKALVLQPLDAKDPGELVNIYRSTAQDPYEQRFSYPDFEFYRDHNRVFSGVVATTGDELALTGGEGIGSPEQSMGSAVAGAFGFRFPSLMHGGAEYVSGVDVSENYFSVLGVQALRGRVFLPQDGRELDAHPAVLLSENYWQRRFGGDVAMLGKTVKLDGVSFTVIGITPHDFLGTNINVPDFWLPMRLRPLVRGGGILRDREDSCCELHGRLARGVSMEQAQAQMTLLAASVRRLHGPRSEGAKASTIRVTPGSHLRPVSISHDPGLALPVLLVMGATGLVLLISCANVASLQLARSAARQREIGVRLSIGASRGRIIRQLLTESALLGLVAGAASMGMAWGALRLLMNEVAASLPMEWGNVAVHVEPDGHVFVYVFAISLIAGILFGLAPAVEASHPELSSALKEEGPRFGLRMRSGRLRDVLVGTQVAVSLFLLIGAGLLIRGSMRSSAMNPGYETRRVTWVNVNYPPGFGYTHEKQIAEVRQLRDRIGGLRGVEAVTSGNSPDEGGLRTAAVGVDGAKPPESETARALFYSFVAGNYFKTLGIPLVRGQGFAEETAGGEAVAVLSESAAEELWPGVNPIGRTITLDASHQFHVDGELMATGDSYHVIAIARDTRGVLIGGEDSRRVYLPLPSDRIDDVPLLVRSAGDPRALMGELNQQVKAVDGNLVVYAETLEGLLSSTPAFVVSRISALFRDDHRGAGVVARLRGDLRDGELCGGAADEGDRDSDGVGGEEGGCFEAGAE